jgi:hypothetical protein
MNSKVALLILSASVMSTYTTAQNTENDITAEFFRIFQGDPMKAMDYAFSTNKWMERNIDGVENVKSKFKDLLPLIGDYYGYEKITEKAIGKDLKLVSFLVRYDRQPVRFTFVFYRPNEKWQVQNLNWDVGLDDELEESAKQNRN